MRLWIAAIFLFGFSAVAAAQDDEVVIHPVHPADGPGRGRRPTLQDAIFVKVIENDGKKQIVFLAEVFRDEEVTVISVTEELKPRAVTNAVGEAAEQRYSAVVTVNTDEKITTRVPAGKKPITVSIQVCNFYNLDNEGLSDVEAAALLTESRSVLLLDNYQGRPVELDPQARKLLRPDCLIVATEERIREPNRNARPRRLLRLGDTLVLPRPLNFQPQPNAPQPE